MRVAPLGSVDKAENASYHVRDPDLTASSGVTQPSAVGLVFATPALLLSLLVAVPPAGADGDASDTDTTTDGNGANADAILQGAKNFFAFNVEYRDRDTAASATATHTEKIHLTVTQAVESQLDDIQVETSAESTRAIETLDKALEEVSSAQAKLGAIQNRLQHNIDNISKGEMLTEQSVGRDIDADFATETSNLYKQQILNQEATAMLAKANQSKQSVLSLLQ